MARPPQLPQVMREVGACIRRRRVDAGLTQEEAASRSGIGYKRYQSLEQGGVNPTIRTLHRVAEALGVGFWELLKR